MLIYSLSSWLVLVARGLALGCLWLELGAHLAPFGLPLDPLGAPWGPSGVPWGSLGAPLGAPWCPLGVPWGSLGDPLGVPWGALGCPRQFSQICRKLDAQFRANVSICTRQRIESSLLGPPWNPFGVPGDPLVFPWESTWDPSGCLGVPFGVPWAPWESLGVPEGALECPMQFSQICRKLDAQLRAITSICTRLRIESIKRGFLFAALGPLGDPIESIGGP